MSMEKRAFIVFIEDPNSGEEGKLCVIAKDRNGVYDKLVRYFGSKIKYRILSDMLYID